MMARINSVFLQFLAIVMKTLIYLQFFARASHMKEIAKFNWLKVIDSPHLMYNSSRFLLYSSTKVLHRDHFASCISWKEWTCLTSPFALIYNWLTLAQNRTKSIVLIDRTMIRVLLCATANFVSRRGILRKTESTKLRPCRSNDNRQVSRSRIKHRITRYMSLPSQNHHIRTTWILNFLHSIWLVNQDKKSLPLQSYLINDLKRSTFPVYVRDKMKPRESLSYRYAVTSLPSTSREENLRVWSRKTCRRICNSWTTYRLFFPYRSDRKCDNGCGEQREEEG